MEYEWDEAKRAANLRKHGVDFTLANRFEWERAAHQPDTRHDYGETRVLSIAPIEGRLHAMVWTPRGERIRVISLRKANRREVNRYESQA